MGEPKVTPDRTFANHQRVPMGEPKVTLAARSIPMGEPKVTTDRPKGPSCLLTGWEVGQRDAHAPRRVLCRPP